jgi:hypothetical protein
MFEEGAAPLPSIDGTNDIPTVQTNDLPDGVAEEEMKMSHEHKLGHLINRKKVAGSMRAERKTKLDTMIIMACGFFALALARVGLEDTSSGRFYGFVPVSIEIVITR